MAWLRKKRLEIISIHIPKTGGTSFWRLLEHIYGPQAVQRVFPKNYQTFTPITVKSSIRALHGHFRYSKLTQQVELSTQVKLISWVRNPVDRVISNYYYRIEKDEMKKVGLLNYASRPTARNRMGHHLTGMDLSNFFFIGILEKFWEDCSQLGHMMNWPGFPHFWENMSGYEDKQVSRQVRDEIRALNKEDEEIYRCALDLRLKRISQKQK